MACRRGADSSVGRGERRSQHPDGAGGKEV